MRAIVVSTPGDPELLQVESIPEPELRRNDMLIRIEACGVCFHDVVTRNGTFRRGVRMPLVPGHEVSGIVEAVGHEVRDFKPGDRVATVQRRHICGRCRYCRTGRETSCEEREFLGDAGLNGGYAELVAVEEDNVTAVPDDVPLDRAAIVACAIGTELNAIRDVARVQPGDRVLVTGAGGGLGIHGIQIARVAGGYVIAVTTSEEKAEQIRAVGAHEVVLIKRGEDFSAKSTSRKQLQDALELVRRGQVKPIVSMELPLEAAPKAHRMVENGLSVGRLVLKPSLSPPA